MNQLTRALLNKAQVLDSFVWPTTADHPISKHERMEKIVGKTNLPKNTEVHTWQIDWESDAGESWYWLTYTDTNYKHPEGMDFVITRTQFKQLQALGLKQFGEYSV